jgi:branched-chain amino acid transport system ATP-binding protein
VTPILTVERVTKRFGGVTAIDAVSFDVQEDEVFGLVGPNGAGKSTLISLISGFLAPDAGTVRLREESLDRLSPTQRARRGLIRTFQAAAPLPGLTVKQNVQVGLSLRYRSGVGAVLARSPRMRREERALSVAADELLARCGLSDEAERSATELPFGQLRLLEVARALAAEPKLLLLDEPGAGLNQLEIDRLSELLRTVRAAGTSVMLVDHDVHFMFGLCDSIALLDFGELRLQGPASEVRASELLRQAYLGPSHTIDNEVTSR